MVEEPLVCICIPTFNAERTVRETVESVLAQSYRNLIVRICDNASTDRTVEIVSAIADPRVEVFRNEKNVGGEGNFNRCIALGAGKYTAIFHADDVYEREMVAAEVAVLEENGDIGAVFTEAAKIDENGRFIGSLVRSPTLPGGRDTFGFDDIFRAVIRTGNFLVCPSAMLRTDIYQREVQRYRSELFGSSADLDVWLRVAQLHSVAVLPRQLMRYRISAAQGTQQLNRLRRQPADFFRVTEYHLSRPEVRAALEEDDLKRYRWLQRTDRVARAISEAVLGEERRVVTLCDDSLSLDAFDAALHTRRGMQTFLVANFLRVTAAFGCAGAAGRAMNRLRQITAR